MTRAAHRKPPSDAFGFFGTIAAHVPDPAAAFADAATRIARAVGCESRAVWAFLDSRHGRLFADDVAIELAAGRDLATAMDAVIDRWQDWRMAGRGRMARHGSFLAGVVQVADHARRAAGDAAGLPGRGRDHADLRAT